MRHNGLSFPLSGSSDARPAVAAEPDAGAADDVTPEAALPDGGATVVAVMPDVVGMNHQLAQDTLQASGFYLLLEEDATGQGRMLVYDRNWEVVSQSIAAGTQVSTGEPVTLSSKKIGE